MKIQVLVAAIDQKDHSLLEQLNIQSDVIVGNQSDFNSVEDFDYKGFKAKYLNFKERGVGLNRNNSLMRATGDICLFADDDMRYVDKYPTIVEKAFSDNPKADVIVFNIKEKNTSNVNSKNKRIRNFEYLRYATPRIAIKLKSIKAKGIYFNECFGGGTEYSFGEDNLFLASCLKNNLKIYSSTEYIAEFLYTRESTWFKGCNDKYLKDKGVLYKTISPRFWKVYCILDSFRHYKDYDRSIVESYYKMTKNKQ